MPRTPSSEAAVVNVRLPIQLRDRIVQAAEADDRSIGYVIRKACEHYLNRASRIVEVDPSASDHDASLIRTYVINADRLPER